MDLVCDVGALQERADRDRAAGRRIALVPTMGALHAGHLALVAAAREQADRVGVSIFVNPAQFNAATDLDAYPRTLEDDLRACERAGVDWVFAPTPEALYPDGYQTWIDVEDLGLPLCGAARPGHFRGVATVVSKLFLAAKPHVAVFGQKDYQQLALIRRMTRDLGFDVDVVGVPTVREADGLALSSRNVHLAGAARAQATALIRALDAAEAALCAGEQRHAAVLQVVREEIGKADLARIDYAELRDPETLEPAPEALRGQALLALAVFFPRGAGDGEVRLIDNRVLPSPRIRNEQRATHAPTEEPT